MASRKRRRTLAHWRGRVVRASSLSTAALALTQRKVGVPLQSQLHILFHSLTIKTLQRGFYSRVLGETTSIVQTSHNNHTAKHTFLISL